MPATILLSAYPGRNVSGGRQLAMVIGERVPHERTLDYESSGTDVITGRKPPIKIWKAQLRRPSPTSAKDRPLRSNCTIS